jgi:hypothetical protein
MSADIFCLNNKIFMHGEIVTIILSTRYEDVTLLV